MKLDLKYNPLTTEEDIWTPQRPALSPTRTCVVWFQRGDYHLIEENDNSLAAGLMKQKLKDGYPAWLEEFPRDW